MLNAILNKVKQVFGKEDSSSDVQKSHQIELKPSTESKYLPTAITLKKEMLPFLTEEQLYTLNTIISKIAEQENSYFNSSLGGKTPKENALYVLKKAIVQNKPSLDILYEISALLGNAVSFTYVDNKWEFLGDFGKRAFEELTKLHCWKFLSTQNKENLEAKLKNINDIQITEADPSLSVKPKEITWQDKVDKLDFLERTAFDAFIEFMPNIIFKTPALKKGTIAYGWKQQTKLYLLEIQIREKILAGLDETTKKLFITENEPISKFSTSLFIAFRKLGWLITENGHMKVGSVPFWEVKVGDNQFKGVFIIHIPEELLPSLTEQDTTYVITLIKPQYEKVKESNKLKANVINSLFK